MTDRRFFLSNGTVAHDSLKGHISDASFVQGNLKTIQHTVANLYAKPNGALDRQLLFGETFLELEQDPKNGFSFGRSEYDGYVGYVETNSLGVVSTASHKVTSLNTHIYPMAHMKTVPLIPLSLGARLAVVEFKSGFSQLTDGKFVPEQAISLINSHAPDFVTVAEQFLGVAYLWGGETSQGIDCSGLVQTALRASGIDCPRDSDLQQDAVGIELSKAAALIRGDLIFWKGHVGIMVSETELLHANAHHMCVAVEPFEQVSSRISTNEGLEIICQRRLNPPA